ncbi:MAG TPA: peptidoglycan -binding protein [Beijerinckiaceae bacterium]|nr:peptidoglycan -binding protein [Beijerinckiaceae bacterium]
MALARGRRGPRGFDYWPGFVDALSTMLLVIIFLLSVFMLAQFFLSQDVSSKDTALARLNAQIQQLTSLLALERSGKTDAQNSLAELSATLETTKKNNTRLQGLLAAGAAQKNAAGGAVAQAQQEIASQKQISARALAQVDILNQQIGALRRQLAAIEDALSVSEARDQKSQAKIADLGSRLNVALAQKVQELARYRSDFFGRLREILGSRPGIRIVGDRFVFDSEVLFNSGKAAVNAQGRAQMDQVASAIEDLEREIPPEIPWVLRVDGHTDKRPVSGKFASNWDLSAARAIAVVQYLIAKGVEPKHLAAAAFGKYQSIKSGDSKEALRANRRIELKLTEP